MRNSGLDESIAVIHDRDRPVCASAMTDTSEKLIGGLPEA
jgi:hypothetical protein